MDNEQSIFDQIEQYHLGLLSKEEAEQMELRIKTDRTFSDYVKFNGFANEIVHVSGLELLRDQMSLDLAKIERKTTLRKWKIGMGILGVLIGLSILWYFNKSNEKRKTSIPDNYQKTDITREQIRYNKTNPSGNNSIPRIEKISSATRPEQVNYKNNVGELLDKPSISLQPQNIRDTTHASESIVDAKQESIREEKTSKDCTISFDAIVQLTCIGEQNGSIQVNQKLISGGTAPYSFHLSNKVQSSSTGVFSDLAKGNYTITITDSKACSASKEITVYEKNCAVKKSFSFNPDYGEKWEMQLNSGKSGSFTIYNRGGVILKSNNFSQDGTIEWDGTNTHGTLADVGAYMCAINYADGKVEIIELSIVR